MIVSVLCLAEEKEELKKSALNFNKEWEVEFVCDNYETKSLIIISHETVSKCKKMDFSKFDGIYLYYGSTIIDTSKMVEITNIRKQAISEKNWSRAKFLNDVLIDIDFIYKHEINLAYPDYLQIETTSFCNAECIMCSHYYNHNKDSLYLQNETLEHMKKALQLSHTVSLNGMGEPFVSPYISEQIDYYANFENKIVTNTNLSILNDRIIAQIQSNFLWLEISVDGATRETYEQIRKNLKFDTVKKNLLRLNKECPDIRKHLAMVVMRQNVHEMPQMVELAYEVGAKNINFMSLGTNIIIGNEMDSVFHYPKVLAYYSKKALKMGEKLGIEVIVPMNTFGDETILLSDIESELEQMRSIRMYKTTEEVKKMEETAARVNRYLCEHDEIQRETIPSTVRCYGICDWVLKQSYIDLKGNVSMCCRNQIFHVGNVNEVEDFLEVWNGNLYKQVRKIFYSGYLPECCLKCHLIGSGNFQFLEIEETEEFYKDPVYKMEQKQRFLELKKSWEDILK